MENRTVECGIHGASDAAFVCRHLLKSLKEAEPSKIGLNEPDDCAGYYEGWCDNCEQVREREGEWNDTSEAYAQVSLICADCFLTLRSINS